MLEHHDDLFAEFPDHKDKIARLMAANSLFAKMVDDYHLLDTKIFEMESAGSPVADSVIEDLKKQRLRLKDRIFTALA